MKILKKGTLFLILIGLLIINIPMVNAEIPVDNKDNQNYDSYNDIPALKSQNYVFEQDSKITEIDKRLLNIFKGDSSWVPRIKFEGEDENKIDTYIFCLSYHDKAPTPDIQYNLASWDTLQKMNEVRYIMEHGFATRSYAEDYSLLKEDYYITQVAIWQLQGDYGYEIGGKRINVLTPENEAKYNATNGTEKDGEAAKAYQKVKDLVEKSRDHESANPIDNTRMIAKYVSSSLGYQILTPFKVYKLKAEVEPPKTYMCKEVDGLYYDNHGSVVSEQEYIQACNLTCQFDESTGTYYDNDGNKVSYESYLSSCYVPSPSEKHYCEIVDGVYYDNNGNRVLKSIYNKSCNLSPSSPENNEVIEKTVNNPKTGIISYLFIIFLLVISLTLYKYSKKKKKFIKIK